MVSSGPLLLPHHHTAQQTYHVLGSYLIHGLDDAGKYGVASFHEVCVCIRVQDRCMSFQVAFRWCFSIAQRGEVSRVSIQQQQRTAYIPSSDSDVLVSSSRPIPVDLQGRSLSSCSLSFHKKQLPFPIDIHTSSTDSMLVTMALLPSMKYVSASESKINACRPRNTPAGFIPIAPWRNR